MGGDGFAPLGFPLLPWENHLGRGQTHTSASWQRRTSRLLDRSGPRVDSVEKAADCFGDSIFKLTCTTEQASTRSHLTTVSNK